MDHLDALEAQSIYILREAFARLKKLALLWSLGKDSNVESMHDHEEQAGDSTHPDEKPCNMDRD